MLDALARLELGVDLGGGSGCRQRRWSAHTKHILIFERLASCRVCYRAVATVLAFPALPAAAAGSTGDLAAGESSASRSLDNGLLSRAESSLRAGGDRERRSNLEAFRGSGSFWSKRDRFAVRRSVSSMSSDLWFDGVGCTGFCCREKVDGRNGVDGDWNFCDRPNLEHGPARLLYRTEAANYGP